MTIQSILNNSVSQVTDYSLTELMYGFKIREEFDLITFDIPQMHEDIIEARSIIK
jgi:hypothetical protein